MSEEYFKGPNGLYYDEQKEELFLLSKCELQQFIDINTYKMSAFNTYTIEGEDMVYTKVKLRGFDKCIYLGEL